MSAADAPGISTQPGFPIVVAPGKLFLVGEYAVLDGGPAVLAAVTRQASAQYASEFPDTTPLIAECQRRAFAALGERSAAIPPGSALVDTEQFQFGAVKLGLGSSAAAAVCAVGAIFEAAGLSIASNRELLFQTADAAHRAAQGGIGSGADVAASVYGGLIRFICTPDAPPSVQYMVPLTSLRVVVFWSGHSASTPALIRAVQALAIRKRRIYQKHMTALKECADRFIAAMSALDANATVAAADDFGKGLASLGKVADVCIFTPAFIAAADLARALGGTAKPSGAGGGDVGIALFGDPAAAQEFVRRCPAELSVLDVGLDLRGARRRLPRGMEMLERGSRDA